MRLPSFKLVVAGVGLLIFVAGGLWVWYGGRSTSPMAPPDSAAREAVESPSPPPQVESATARTFRPRPRTGRKVAVSPENAADPAPSQPVPEPAGDPAQWEKKIDDILTADGDESQKAAKLLELIPTLPEEAQIEAAQHFVNLVSDERYVTAGQYLTNTTTAEGVLDVLVGDLMNRPNTLKLPLLLEVARISEHPKAGEARELLEFYISEDLGTDWNAWEKALTTWIKENPE